MEKNLSFERDENYPFFHGRFLNSSKSVRGTGKRLSSYVIGDHVLQKICVREFIESLALTHSTVMCTITSQNFPFAIYSSLPVLLSSLFPPLPDKAFFT